MPYPDAANASKADKVLVYLFGSLGDSIVAIPALRAVRRRFPSAEIVMLQNFRPGLVVASQVIPKGLVDRYLSYESGVGGIGRAVGFLKLWLLLRRESFDAAVYLVIGERPAKAVARDRMFFRSTGIVRLYGFHALSDEQLFPKDAAGRPLRAGHEAVLKLGRLERDGIETRAADLKTPLIEVSSGEKEEAAAWLKQRSAGAVPLISLAPGCKTIANQWPLDRFARLGELMLAERPCEIIITGGPPEREMGEKLVNIWGRGVNAAGAFSVRQSAAMLSMCSFHIGLDTGTTHLAAAVGTRCFSIYGERNNPGTWFPLGDGHTLLHHPVPCAACRAEVCPVPGHPCMKDIPVESAWERLREFMDGPAGRIADGSGINVIAV